MTTGSGLPALRRRRPYSRRTGPSINKRECLVFFDIKELWYEAVRIQFNRLAPSKLYPAVSPLRLTPGS